MIDTSTNGIVEALVGAVDIPESAYEKAEARYRDLGDWFTRKPARCSAFDPHLYPQGSFRLGTVIRPVDENAEYDLDVGCRLRSGVSKATHTQRQLKEMVGADLEDYRGARGIKDRREEKHRCWRLKYADHLRFHLDTVPSIPETFERRRLIRESILQAGATAELATLTANLTGAITDNRLWNYAVIDDGWRLSNAEGFARWFEARMKLARGLAEAVALRANVARIDDLPAYRWKSPLQRCVQLLKRHRDIRFADDPDGKPASIILTTLAARAYQGQVELGDALAGIASTLGDFVNPTPPRVPNPVNPAEDFADRWSDSASRHHNLEAKFWAWLRRAQQDSDSIGRERKPELIVAAARGSFGAILDVEDLKTKLVPLPGPALLKSAAVPAGLSFPNKPLMPQKPAGFAHRR